MIAAPPRSPAMPWSTAVGAAAILVDLDSVAGDWEAVAGSSEPVAVGSSVWVIAADPLDLVADSPEEVAAGLLPLSLSSRMLAAFSESDDCPPIHKWHASTNECSKSRKRYGQPPTVLY